MTSIINEMKKNEILEAIFALVNEEIDRALDEDQALQMSDERRAKFKKTVFSNPPAYNSAGKIQEAPMPPAAPEEPVEPAMDASADGGSFDSMPGGDAGGDLEMGGDDLGGDPAAGGDLGGTGGAGGMPGGEDLDGDGMTDDLGGGGGDLGGGGMGGFGGGGGGGGDLGGMGDEGGDLGGEGEAAPEPSSHDPFASADSLEDKLQVILDTAEELAAQTQDPQKVLKAVKGMIQNGFENPDKAARAISDLFDTDNPVLQQVSRRLALFTWGV